MGPPANSSGGPIASPLLRTLLSLALGPAAFAAAVGIGLGLTLHLAWWTSFMAGFFLAVALVALAMWLREYSIIWTACIAGMLAMTCGIPLEWYADASSGPIVRDISINSIAEYPGASGYTFDDAATRTDILAQGREVLGGGVGAKSTTSNTKVLTYYAVPIVGHGWTQEMPIPAWAGCLDQAGCPETWDQPLQGGIQVQEVFQEGYAKAIRDVAARMGLVLSEPILVLTWTGSPEAAIAGYKETFVSALASYGIFWLVCLVGGKAFFAWRRRAKNTPPKK